MSEEWDDSIKRMFREHPQDFVSWLVKGATYRGAVSGELRNRRRQTDILFDIVQQESLQEALLHTEIQSIDDKKIEVWRFNYVVIKLWEISAEELINLGLPGLLPLVPLTRDGTKPENIKRVADELFAAKETDLLALAKMVA